MIIFILLTPFGFFLFFRVLLPFIWCFNYVFFNDNIKYLDIVFLHMLYLFLMGCCIIYIMKYIYSLNVKHKFYLKNIYYLNVVKAKKYVKFSLFLLLMFLIFNYSKLPIFSSRGSDAIVELVQKNKIETFFWYGILGMAINIMIISSVYLFKNKNFIYFILSIFSIVTGKKSALISLFSKIIFVNILLGKIKRMSLFKLFLVVIVLFFSILFIIFQFIRTAHLNISLLEGIKLIFNIVYSSSTVYLTQFINMEGIIYASTYSESLGNGGVLLYIFNPFLKFVFHTGIYKAIGPYMSEMLYNNNFPNGVNPTLFFEYIFVWGTKIILPLAFIHMIFIFLFMKILIKRMVKLYLNNGNILLLTMYFQSILFCLFYLNDTLNAIRSLPFIFLPLFLFIIEKFLYRIQKK